MTTKSRVTYERLSYTELLATLPWVALLPKGHTRDCAWSREHPMRKPCKTRARLIYFNLDGTTSAFCHHHLHDARIDVERLDHREERDRHVLWDRRTVKIERS